MTRHNSITRGMPVSSVSLLQCLNSDALVAAEEDKGMSQLVNESTSDSTRFECRFGPVDIIPSWLCRIYKAWHHCDLNQHHEMGCDYYRKETDYCIEA